MTKNLVCDIHDKPNFPQLIVFALQQILAIMAATITVPLIVGNGMSTSAALFGAGVGTLVYLLCTKFRMGGQAVGLYGIYKNVEPGRRSLLINA